MPKPLHLIVACSQNRVIGRRGKLPWHIPEDLKFFHAETAGQICVLGRVCYETWPRVREDGRRPIVVTSNHALAQPGVLVAPSLDAALALADDLPGEIYVCGGQRIYEETLALAGTRPLRLHLTLIHTKIPGDRFMPEWRGMPFRMISFRKSHDEDHRYTFYELER